jgi:hypothetical protein
MDEAGQVSSLGVDLSSSIHEEEAALDGGEVTFSKDPGIRDCRPKLDARLTATTARKHGIQLV